MRSDLIEENDDGKLLLRNDTSALVEAAGLSGMMSSPA